MIPRNSSSEVKTVLQGWRVEGNQVIFFVKENGVETEYVQDIGPYLNEKGVFDRSKLMRAFMLDALAGHEKDSNFGEFI